MANEAAFADQRLSKAVDREKRRKAIEIECDSALRSLLKLRPAEPVAPQVDQIPQIGTIYFVGPADGPIKIGYASRLEFRLKDLRTMNALPLVLHATVQGPAALEREYHRRFAASRLHGEWFSPHPDILAEIERLSK